MKNKYFIPISIMIIILIVSVSYITVKMSLKNTSKYKYNFDNLEVIKYYPFDNRKEKKINLKKTEKESLIKIINSEKFKEDKNVTNCIGALNYKIKFDVYEINITTSCGPNYLIKKGQEVKKVILSKRLIDFIEKY